MILGICITVAVLLLAVFCVAVFYFWKYAVVRGSDSFEEPPVPIFDGPYAPLIRNGVEWFKSQPTERKWITSHDGLRLAAEYLPAENPKGTIITVHGYRSNCYFDFSCVYETYHSWGYNILTLHDRAHGFSEGKYIGFGILDRFDVARWAQYAHDNMGGDLFLDGLSMGASSVLMATGLELPETVRGVIADCGFTSPREECGHVLKSNFKLPKFPLLYACSFLVKLTAGYDLGEYSTLEALKTNKIPVLFIHGDRDSFVPTEMGYANYEACVAEKELLIVKGAGHAESFLMEPELCKEKLWAFLEKYRTK